MHFNVHSFFLSIVFEYIISIFKLVISRSYYYQLDNKNLLYTIDYIRQLYGGVPERLIGAVLKTVERSRVPWVRIPPPPNKNGLTFVRPVFILCGVGENTCNLTGHFI